MMIRSQRLHHLGLEHKTAMRLASAVRELLPDDLSALPKVAARIREVFLSDMQPHFADEETYVYPDLIEIGREDLVERMRLEHERLFALVEALQSPSPELIQEFGEALRLHVEFEEEVVFEALEQARKVEGDATA